MHLRESTGYQQTLSSSSAGEGSITTPAAPHLNAVFTVHLDDDSSSRDTRKLVEWIHALTPGVGLELMGVYVSRLTVITLGAPWRIWAQLSGLRGVTLVCKSFGQNMLPGLVGQQLPTVKKENVLFEGKQQSGLEILKR